MPPRNDDLFQRLRRAGIRKPVAKALSELTEDAGKKAIAAGHRAVAELRALADELEKRLPPAVLAPGAGAAPSASPAAPSAATLQATTPPTRKATATSTPRARKATATPTARTRKATATPTARTDKATAPSTSRTGKAAAAPASALTGSAPAPRGENKAKILAALASGPQTASEISQQTGIATATVSAALTRLSKAGEITKATRGYALPS
jgi:hypothetical protein